MTDKVYKADADNWMTHLWTQTLLDFELCCDALQVFMHGLTSHTPTE